jgi:hypothetical protein
MPGHLTGITNNVSVPGAAGSNGSNGVSYNTPVVQVITYGASITPDASLFTLARITMTGNMTVNAPLNPVDGMVRYFEFIQDATGLRLLTLNAVFAVPAAITLVASVTASARDIMVSMYSASLAKWIVIGFVKGL